MQEGRYAEAEQHFEQGVAAMRRSLGPDHPFVAVALAGQADVKLKQKDWVGALELFRSGASIVARLAKRGTHDVGTALTSKRESEAEQQSFQFVKFVQAAHQVALQAGGPDPGLSDETFRMAQWARGSDAAESLAQMAARAAQGDPALAALVRERQDLVIEWQKRDEARDAAAARTPDKRDARAEAANMARLAAIDARIAAIDNRLKADFPDYAALVRPEPLSIADVQAQLGDNEALVMFLDAGVVQPLPEATFIWAVTKTQSRWVRSDLGRSALVEYVAALRCGLDPTSWLDAADWSEATQELVRQRSAQIQHRKLCETLVKARPRTEVAGVVPMPPTLPFDAGRAHALYEALFGQVKDLIRDKHLLIVPSGALTRLPFNVLVTEPPNSAIPASIADYRAIAWLGAQQPISVLPSAASLKALRATAKPSRARHLLLGIGNPLLDGPDQRSARRAEIARHNRTCQALAEVGQQVADARRGNGAPFQAVFRGTYADVAKIREWEPLPETANELCAIRARLGVPEGDILLGARATESAIKALSASGRLADYRIVQFATHGALSGEVQGSAEPGLILSPPDAGTSDAKKLEQDDGFLTASEISSLKLDADWVILSACNTAAGGVANAQALSGIARAFFYAGARALLVSHWAVPSATSVELTTRAFQELAARPGLGRAEALRISMREIINNGRVWQAHPSQWAPFVVVGEGER